MEKNKGTLGGWWEKTGRDRPLLAANSRLLCYAGWIVGKHINSITPDIPPCVADTLNTTTLPKESLPRELLREDEKLSG